MPAKVSPLPRRGEGQGEGGAAAPTYEAQATRQSSSPRVELGAMHDQPNDDVTLEEAVANRRFEGRLENQIAAALRQQGKMEDARRRYERALAIVREVGDRWMEGRVLGHLGGLLQEIGKVDEAAREYERALDLHREVGDRRF